MKYNIEKYLFRNTLVASFSFWDLLADVSCWRWTAACLINWTYLASTNESISSCRRQASLCLCSTGKPKARASLLSSTPSTEQKEWFSNKYKASFSYNYVRIEISTYVSENLHLVGKSLINRAHNAANRYQWYPCIRHCCKVQFPRLRRWLLYEEESSTAAQLCLTKREY